MAKDVVVERDVAVAAEEVSAAVATKVEKNAVEAVASEKNVKVVLVERNVKVVLVAEKNATENVLENLEVLKEAVLIAKNLSAATEKRKKPSAKVDSN
jgi:hypothetical protein